MTTDGGLPLLLMKELNERGFACRIETGGTGRGIPDIHYVIEGEAGWIECKFTSGNAIDIRPEQCAWAERYARNRGRVFLAIRQKKDNTRGKVDRLWLLGPQHIRLKKLDEANALLVADGGPARWNWDAIMELLKK